MEFQFDGEVWHWRGPAPYYFVSVPPDISEILTELTPEISYGWGMIPGRLTVGSTSWETALWPKDGGHVVPLKVAVRRAEGIDIGDQIAVTLAIDAD